jgi:DNA-binding HxlR family transcriptional regulator
MSTTPAIGSAGGPDADRARDARGSQDDVVVTEQARRECPVTGVLRRVGDKWSPVVIRLLAERPHGFNELDRAIEGISRRILTRTLRMLEAEGYVRRATGGGGSGAHRTGGHRVEYSLTERGCSLRELLSALGDRAVVNARPAPGATPPAG